jgi:hypothetical protein
MATVQRYAFATFAALSLSACQSAGGSRIRMEPESAVLAQGMHPTIRTAFEADFIHIIVKGTSAEAMALSAVLRSNDIEFAPGTSRKEVAQKVVEHRRASNCAALASRLNVGGYENLFLERI